MDDSSSVLDVWDPSIAESLFELMNQSNTTSQRSRPTPAEGRASSQIGLAEFLGTPADLGNSAVAEARARAKKDKNSVRARFIRVFGKSTNKSGKPSTPEMPSAQAVFESQQSSAQSAAKFEGSQEYEDMSPYFQPLKYNLQAREEKLNISSSTPMSPSAVPSPITVARHRAEAHLALIGPHRPAEGPPDMEPVPRLRDASLQNEMAWRTEVNTQSIRFQDREFHQGPMPLIPVSDGHAPSASWSDANDLENYSKYHLENVILELAQDASCRPAWRLYLESYSLGQFNLNNPPSPPPLSSSFEYFPCLLSPGESNRMKLSRAYDDLWLQWGQEKAKNLLHLAMKKFNTENVAVSFFDETSEVFRAENGYNSPCVNRAISFAAHCILSKETLVILDTEEDWRFIKNPMVTSDPKIRFWAGAPMMSPCGEVLGVFSIFHNEPRKSFTPAERRELAEFTSLVMTDLRLQNDALVENRQRTTPLLDRDSVINAPYRPQSVQSEVAFNGIDSDLVPPGLIFQKDKTPKPIDRAREDDQTPPSSAMSSSGYLDTPSSLGDHVTHVPGDHVPAEDGMIQDQSPHISMSSYLNGYRVSSPRPFSSSDLTSLHILPPNTPAYSVREADLSTSPDFDNGWNEFKDLTDEDCAEPIQRDSLVTPKVVRRSGSDRLTGTSAPKPEFGRLESRNHLANNQRESDGSDRVLARQRSNNFDMPAARSSQRTALEAEPGKEPLAWTYFTLAPTGKGPRKVDGSPWATSATPGPHGQGASFQEEGEAEAEAAFACSHYAQILGYDLIYALELTPARPYMSEEEMLGPNGLRTKILFAYGLTKPLHLAPLAHLHVIRARGAQHWLVPTGSQHEYGGYELGRLISIHHGGGPMRLRTSGIVLGAFRTAGRMGAGTMGSAAAAAEVDRLIALGKELKSILFKDRKQTRSNTKLPNTKLHITELPNTELPNSKLHATGLAFPANEAQEYMML